LRRVVVEEWVVVSTGEDQPTWGDTLASRPGAPPRARRTIRGYEIVRKVGRGGNANVYEARSPSGERVAIKELRKDRVGNPDAKRRFLREYEVTRQLSHPQIARMIDTFSEKRVQHIVMEFIDGVTLRRLLRRFGTLEIPLACGLVSEIASILSYVHRRNVLHRDIKPDNIMVTVDGQLKLTDFGIAHDAARRATVSLTRTGWLIGTPFYMSPEQLQGVKGRDLDARCDVYCLGMVLYECLSRRSPYSLKKTDPLFKVVKVKTTEDPRIVLPEDPELESLLRRATARDPAERIPDMAQLIEELRPWAARPSVVRSKLRGMVRRLREEERAKEEADPGPVRPRARGVLPESPVKRTALRLLALLVLCAVAAVGYAGWRAGGFVPGLRWLWRAARHLVGLA
jgi:serine/threonine protein kinase